MSRISIHLDLDETLIHSRVKNMATQDLCLLFPAEEGCEIRDLRIRFDQLVECRLSDKLIDFSERFRARRKMEVQVAEELLVRNGWVPIHSNEPELKKKIMRIRPGIVSFLEKLVSFGPLFICTAAGRTYAQACLQTANVMDMFTAIHSREDMADHTTSVSFPVPFLVDNLPVDDVMVLHKLRFLGLPIKFDFETAVKEQFLFGKIPNVDYGLVSRHHFEIPPYFGQEDNAVLFNMLPELCRKLKELMKMECQQHNALDAKGRGY